MTRFIPHERFNPTHEINKIVKRNVDWHHHVLRGADRKLQSLPPGEFLRLYHKIERELSPLSANPWSAGNHSFRRRLGQALIQRLSSLFQTAVIGTGDNCPTFGFLTIINEQWDTSEQSPIVDLSRIRYEVERFLLGTNYIGIVEFLRIDNAASPQNSTERRLCVHTHLVVWNQYASEIVRVNGKQLNPFSGGFVGGRPIDFQEIQTVEMLKYRICYILKLPLEAKRVIKRHKTSVGIPQSLMLKGSKRTNIGALRLFELLQSFTIWDLLLHGGEGSPLLTNVRKRLTTLNQ